MSVLRVVVEKDTSIMVERETILEQCDDKPKISFAIFISEADYCVPRPKHESRIEGST